MRPRRPGCSRTSATSSTVSGATTVAAVGAVRPQPVSSRRAPIAFGSTGIDADREACEQERAEHLEDAVAEYDFLGRAATSLLHGERVPEDGEHERDDRQPEPELVANLVRLFERPQRVASDGDA